MKPIGQHTARKMQHHILVVEDEPHVGLFVEVLLASRGYKVSLCVDSVDALSRFAARPWQFDLVLTDQNMPQMCGVELAKAMRAIRADIPIILCSGLGLEDLRASMTDNEVSSCISKPLQTAELLKVIADKLMYRHDRGDCAAGG